MLKDNIQMGTFVTQLKTILNSMVLKRDKSAAVFETDLTAKKLADRYINIVDFGTTWDSYVTFDSTALIAAGLDKNLVSYYQESKDNIPRAVRAKLMVEQQKNVVQEFTGVAALDSNGDLITKPSWDYLPTWEGEKNDYYRMLAGKPPVDTTTSDYVYAPTNDYGVPTTIPLHELRIDYIDALQASGLLDKIITNNSTKGYLKFLGDKAITPYDSRTAQNYEILYVTTDNVESSLVRDFRLYYDKARTYYMVGFYNKEYSNMFTWYDQFIGLCIVVMAIQRLITSIYRQGLTRDFYDESLIRYLFQSYSIPFIEGMNMTYQKALAKNLNLLLMYKSTDKVLYDIAYLLGFYTVNIYKYYLVKKHKLDNNNNPIFTYTETTNSDGTVTKTPDYSQMFDYYFQQINLKEKDLNTAITDDKNRVDYFTIVDRDPYWVSDDELYAKLRESNFNHIITKYMSLDVSYKIVEMMYEVCHTIRMFFDKKTDVSRITVNIPKITNNDINLYDLIIFLNALGAKKLGLPGNVPINASQIATVYGFNFKKDLLALQDAIKDREDDYTKIDQGLAEYIKNINIAIITKNDIGTIYSNIKAFRKMITYYIWSTKDLTTYEQYKKLYRTTLLVSDVKAYYTDNDGNQQTSYAGLLQANNPDLYTIYASAINDKKMSDDNYPYYPTIENYINEIFVKMASLSDEYKYLSSVNSTDSVFDYVMKLIRFFKSYTVDFVNSGIHYFFDDHYLMAFKLLDVWKYGDITDSLEDFINHNGRQYKDYIHMVSDTFKITQNLNIDEEIRTDLYLWVFNKIHFINTLSVGATSLSAQTKLALDGFIDSSIAAKHVSGNLGLADVLYNEGAKLNTALTDDEKLKDLLLAYIKYKETESLVLKDLYSYYSDFPMVDKEILSELLKDYVVAVPYYESKKLIKLTDYFAIPTVTRKFYEYNLITEYWLRTILLANQDKFTISDSWVMSPPTYPLPSSILLTKENITKLSTMKLNETQLVHDAVIRYFAYKNYENLTLVQKLTSLIVTPPIITETKLVSELVKPVGSPELDDLGIDFEDTMVNDLSDQVDLFDSDKNILTKDRLTYDVVTSA